MDPDGEDVQPVQRDGEERGEVRVLAVEVDGLAARGFLGGRQRRVDVVWPVHCSGVVASRGGKKIQNKNKRENICIY